MARLHSLSVRTLLVAGGLAFSTLFAERSGVEASAPLAVQHDAPAGHGAPAPAGHGSTPDVRALAEGKPASHATPKPSAGAARPTAPPAPMAEPAPAAPTKPLGTPSGSSIPKAEVVEAPATLLDADGALDALKAGNARWVAGKMANPNVNPSRRKLLADDGQHPYAMILTCSDSRLPVERIFDCGSGEVFVLRVAGNVIDADLAGTIEYGAEHLHAPVLVVMGHTKCGAVGAAATHAHVEGNIATLVDHIEPAVQRAQRLHPELTGAALTSESIKENVWQSVFDLLKSSEMCRSMVQRGELKIVGAVCDITDGSVEWMGEHPWQAEVVAAISSRETETTKTTQVETDNKEH